MSYERGSIGKSGDVRLCLRAREVVPEEDYEPWGKSQLQTDEGVEMGGQCGAGKETVCTKPRSERERMCWKGKICKGQRDWQRVGSDWDQIIKDLHKPCQKVCLGFILKSMGSYSKALSEWKVGNKIIFGFSVTEMSKAWSLSSRQL